MSIKIPGKDKVLSMLGMERKRNPTTIRDIVGNIIKEGSLLFWVPNRLIITCTQINPGGLVVPGTGQPTPGELTFEVKIPFRSDQPNLVVDQFIVVVDPRSVIEPQKHISLDDSPPASAIMQ